MRRGAPGRAVQVASVAAGAAMAILAVAIIRLAFHSGPTQLTIMPPRHSSAVGHKTPVPQKLGAFTTGLLLGAYTGGQDLRSFDSQVGPAVLTVSYVHWGTPVSSLAALIKSAARQHAEAIIELEPGALGHSARQIASGSGGSDDWLRQLGWAIKRVGDPVAISFFPEMNGPWHKAWSHGATEYVAAFRHVHNVLGAVAGRRITWVWQASAIHKSTPNPMPYWPGARYVDVAAMDSYYYYQHDTFDAVFGKTVRLIRQVAPNLPLMIGETATGPLFNRQVLEIKDLFAGIRRDHLIGLVWFNQFQHYAPYQFHQDWRLQDNPAALAAFRSCLKKYGPLAQLKSH